MYVWAYIDESMMMSINDDSLTKKQKSAEWDGLHGLIGTRVTVILNSVILDIAIVVVNNLFVYLYLLSVSVSDSCNRCSIIKSSQDDPLTT